jgi:Sulfate permease family
MNTIKSKKKNLASHALAGLTISLVNIPQSMAHALLAAVNPVYGLFTLMLATPVGVLFTSAKFMNISTICALSAATGDPLKSYPGEYTGIRMGDPGNINRHFSNYPGCVTEELDNLLHPIFGDDRFQNQRC